MNNYLAKLWDISQKNERIIVGVMSGTSLDGLDVALCKVSGSGSETNLELLEFVTKNYSADFRKRLRNIQSQTQTNTLELTLLHSELGFWYGDVILNLLKQWNISTNQVDLIASHGQTIFHAPAEEHGEVNGTLQIVDGDHIAQKTGIITISDFRQKHVAAGGEGAPLAGIFDEMHFRHPAKNRMLLNLGGIANVTWLPSIESGEKAVFGDTGPANTLINEAMQKYYDQPFDRDGKVAAAGDVHSGLVRYILLEPYFRKSFPKSTGQEEFRLQYVENLMQGHGILLSHDDLIATLTAVTSQSISRCFDELTGGRTFECYVSGGGLHNKTLMADLKSRVKNAEFKSFDELGLNADSKEAIMMAFYANELVAGKGFPIPDVTEENVHLGKISLPG